MSQVRLKIVLNEASDNCSTRKINMKHFKWSGNFHHSLFMVCPSQVSLIFMSSIAIQHQELQVCSLF